MIKQMYQKTYLFLGQVLGHAPNKLQMCQYIWGGIRDRMLHGSTVTDFFELTFFNKTYHEKKKYMTWPMSKKVVFAMDDRETEAYYSDKFNMYSALHKYLGRDILFIKKDTQTREIEDFFAKHNQALYKPNHSSCGQGICVVEKKDMVNLQQEAVLDELVIQHGELSKICPSSVNTVRVITAKQDGKVIFIGACLRMSQGDAVIDNYSAGGIIGAIDLETGRIIDDGEDRFGKRYEKHPFTGVKFKGYQVPLWNNLIKMVEDMHLSFPLNYVGWDIAIRENDCVLIEANARPVVNTIQVAGNGGKREIYQRILVEKRKLSEN